MNGLFPTFMIMFELVAGATSALLRLVVRKQALA